MSRFLIILFLLIGFRISYAQTSCAKLIPLCKNSFIEDYNWDGRYWRAELYGNETTEVYYTFFKGLRYRLIPCGSSDEKSPLRMRIYNANRALLLDTGTQNARPYWDLELSSTQLLIIELYYPSGNGCAALIIGHKAGEALASQE
jgi:hypothetical protein